MKSYQIHFIRHGATVEDNKGKYIGRSNVQLSQQGIEDLKSTTACINIRVRQYFIQARC